jgi:hypothetical protein
MKHYVLIAAAFSAIAAPARADKKVKPVKAQFLCGTYVDGKIKAPVGSGKRAKLTDPIACAIHMDDPAESHMGNVHTVRYTTDAQTKKQLKITTTGKTTDFGAGSTPRDFELVMKPNVSDENGEVLYRSCEDFDIVATISDDLGVYFTKTLKVQQNCPKPPAIKAGFECSWENRDGKRFDYPGNGAKLQPRIEQGTVYCGIDGTGYLQETLNATVTLKGKKTSKTVEAQDEPGAKRWKALIELKGGDEVEACSITTLEGSLKDDDGNVRWSGSLKIPQNCPD